jgi:hypothetical protein
VPDHRATRNEANANGSTNTGSIKRTLDETPPLSHVGLPALPNRPPQELSEEYLSPIRVQTGGPDRVRVRRPYPRRLALPSEPQSQGEAREEGGSGTRSAWTFGP